MKALSSSVSRLVLCVLACLTASCALPPREAWQYVQSNGLIPYMLGGYPAAQSQNRYLSRGAPFRAQQQSTVTARVEATERPREVVPYRPRTQRSEAVAEVEAERPVTPREIEPKRAPSKPPVEKSSNATASRQSTLDTPTIKPAPKPTMDTLPYGTPIAGRPGMVMSPFASKEQLVDVTGMSAGDPVKCPYSGKLFRVPPTQQAAAKPTPEPISPPPASEPSASTPAPAPGTGEPK